MTIPEIVELFGSLQSDRGTVEAHWQEVAERFLPVKATVTSIRTPGEKLVTTNYDSTPQDSLMVFAAGLHSYLTNPSSRWFNLDMRDKNLRDVDEVKNWLRECEDGIFAALNNSNFNQQIHETYIDFGCFGTANLYEEDDPKEDIRFYTRPPSECYIMENEREEVDQLIRKCSYTVRQAWLKWGKNAGTKVLKLKEANKWTDTVDVLHAVMRRETRDVNKKDSVNKAWSSQYIELSEKHPLSDSGYDEFPFFCPRQIKVSGEQYGYAQTMIALADTKTLNSMSKTILKAAQKQVDPPIVVPDDGYILPFKTTAGAVNFKSAGNQDTVDILSSESKGNLSIGLEMEEQRRTSIRRALFVDMFLALTMMDKGMTATEVLERVNEKMLILGPILGRLMNELLDPLIHRTMAILLRNGKLPPPPAALAGKEYKVVYISPLAKAQRLSEAKSINDFLVTVSAINAVNPAVMDMVDCDKAVKRLSDIYNVPTDIVRTEEEVKQIRQAREEAMRQQQELLMAQQGGDAAVKFTQANKNMKESNASK